jgi:Family of unknown function (DUF5760)
MNENNEMLGTVIKSRKELFIENVKRWTAIDTKLRIVNENTRKLRDMKHDLTEDICNYMTKNDLANNTICISDGDLKIYDKKEYSPLTFAYVQKCLDEIIANKEDTAKIIDYMKQHREVKISKDIRRRIKSQENQGSPTTPH